MFSISCECGAELAGEAFQKRLRVICDACGAANELIAADEIDERTAGVDFDAVLRVVNGPERLGDIIRLGGIAPIEVGREAGSVLPLPGDRVSRKHFLLSRIDFGPSRWLISDNRSTNGLFVNGVRASSQELQNGDVINVGDYELHYAIIEEIAAATQDQISVAETRTDPPRSAAPLGLEADAGEDLAELELLDEPEFALAAPTRTSRSIGAARAALAAPVAAKDGPPCPSCERLLGRNAKVCVQCGIHVPSGRPLLTSNDLDENLVYGNTRTVLMIVSWIVWVTPLPIPLASQAYGRHKPWAIWSIAAMTILASVAFFVANIADDNSSSRSLMLWPAHIDYESAAVRLETRHFRLEHSADNREEPGVARRHAIVVALLRERLRPFQWWQLLTCAFLHDSSGILPFVLHLGGNMLFLIVFGSRVNSIIGNTATAICYPILAVTSAATFLLSLPSDAVTPLLGASGAINGLAGMYLVLFPAHMVYCAMWIRVRFRLFYKIFMLRGFWVLLIYFAYDGIMVIVGADTHTAHWAHIGGFVTGVGLGVVLLVSRRFACSNGDLLSLTLGKHAWALVGKPAKVAVLN